MQPRSGSAIVAVGLVVALAGCANYRAVSAFADRTSSMTGVVRSELTELQTLCVEQAQVVLVVNGIADDSALAQCAADQRAQGRFAALTIDVLDDYAGALAALADDKPFDLSPSVRAAGTRVRALKERGGDALVGGSEVDAVTKIAEVLVEIAATHERDAAVERMVRATPDLAVTGRALKAFFVAAPDAPARSPYANFVTAVAGSTTSTQLILESAPMRRAEPIRTAELLRDLRQRQRLLDRRSTAVADAVPLQIAAAIDAWLAALDRFAVDAKRPDSRELIDRLKRLQAATRVAKDAVAAH